MGSQTFLERAGCFLPRDSRPLFNSTVANVVSPQEGECAGETLGAFWKPAWGMESEDGGRVGEGG